MRDGGPITKMMKLPQPAGGDSFVVHGSFVEGSYEIVVHWIVVPACHELFGHPGLATGRVLILVLVVVLVVVRAFVGGITALQQL